MRSDWLQTTLGEISAPNNGMVDGPFGSNLPASSYTESGIPIVRGSNLTVGMDRFKANDFVYVSTETFSKLARSGCVAGDIIFTKKGTLGQTGIIPTCGSRQYLLSSNQMRLRVDIQKALPEYVYYWVSSPSSIKKIRQESEHTGVPKINLAYLRDFEITLPSLTEQARIINLLSSMDSKIDSNKKANATLESIAQTLFKSWFVDFDPVKAKMRGEQPEGMDEATAALFPDKLVQSDELGMIPEGWKESCIDEHFNITMGQSPKGDTYNETGEGTPFFQGRKDFGARFPTLRVYTTDPKRFAKAHDTLISVRAPVGDKNMAKIDCCVGRGLAAIRHKSGCPGFTYAFISHIEKSLQNSGSSGTVFSSINQKELKNVPFVAPEPEVISAFSKQVAPINAQIRVLSDEIITLANLRDTLLPKLLSGELDLNQLDTEVA